MLRRVVFAAALSLTTLTGVAEARLGDFSARKVPLSCEAKDAEGLRGFLVGVEFAIEKHHWPALLAMADSSHRDAQLGMGMNTPQYLAELMSLNMVGNSLALRGMGINESALNQIVSVQLRTCELDAVGELRMIKGEVTLADRTTRRLEIWATQVDGEWVLTGAMG